MSDKLDHRKGREANEKAIRDRMLRIRHETGASASDKQINEYARKRSEEIAKRAVREE